jgi:hypothetical protein
MTPKKRRNRRLIRNRNTFEFLTRYPNGTAAINGYRRAARHFKFHTLEDPTMVGSDAYRLFVHKSAQKLREAAKVIGDAYTLANTADDEELIDEAEMWLCDSDVLWFAQDWKYWDMEQDEGALELLGWERLIAPYGDAGYRVTLRLAKKK